MASTNKIFIQVDNEILELKGEELKAFDFDRKQMQQEYKIQKEFAVNQKELKISAYKKLGLTDEEIQAII